jgi:hypothetical protein
MVQLCAALAAAILRGQPLQVRRFLAVKGFSQVAFSWNAYIYSVARLLSAGAVMLGDIEITRPLAEKAKRDCEALEHRPELALSRLQLAELLLDHYPDERDAAIQHLDFAIAELRDMKMQPGLERALGRRGLLKA